MPVRLQMNSENTVSASSASRVVAVTGSAWTAGAVDQHRNEVADIDTGMLRIAYSAAVMRVEGEVDLANAEMFGRALARGLRYGTGDFHLNLAGVAFMAVCGLREIVRTGRTADHWQRRVVLHRTPLHTHKMLRITGWDAAPGLVLHC
ncbi:STAS domain-containing protein [Spirillospora sp. NPDC046719]